MCIYSKPTRYVDLVVRLVSIQFKHYDYYNAYWIYGQMGYLVNFYMVLSSDPNKASRKRKYQSYGQKNLIYGQLFGDLAFLTLNSAILCNFYDIFECNLV